MQHYKSKSRKIGAKVLKNNKNSYMILLINSKEDFVA